ncbi:hypothetical protein ACFL5O_05970 [Myxococcota bacterium]
MHFHGAFETTESVFRASKLNAVVMILNLGIGSGPYEQMFAGRDSFEQFLAGVTRRLATACRGAKVGRVALSSWSAGYGAALRILQHTAGQQQVDAVLLADGLHAALAKRRPRTVRDTSLAPITRFAERAAQGQRLLAITHSQIRTPKYASTTETADFLLNSQGLSRQPRGGVGPRPSMQLSSFAHEKGFWVTGYRGNNTGAHCDHLFALGQTLLPVLENRWNEDRQAGT